MLCRIYKKNNTHRPMDHEREDSMDDLTGPIAPSISVSQQNMKLQFPKAGTSYGSLVDQNLFEGMVTNDGINSAMSTQLASSSSIVPASGISNNFNMKRTLPSLYWNIDEEPSGPSSSKRLALDDSDESVTRTDGNASNSIASLLCQLPQTPSLHQQAMLGSVGDISLFRGPCHLPGLNWYS